jgi:type III pantothenate kinase
MKKPVTEFLLVDVGNTRLKWTTAGRRWPTRIAGDIASKEATSTWINALARKYPNHPTILASVVPKTLSSFRRAFRGRLVEVNGAMPDGFHMDFRFHYPKPVELGADRIAAAVAAHAWGSHPAIIVACGTATAFTVLDAKGRLCGGVIAPGLQAQLDTLLGATAQLPATTLRPPRRALARSTEEAIRAGVMLNFQGGVKEIIRQLAKELPDHPKPQLIVTGGNARHFPRDIGFPVKLRPLLVFEGLLIIGFRLFGPVP